MQALAFVWAGHFQSQGSAVWREPKDWRTTNIQWRCVFLLQTTDMHVQSTLDLIRLESHTADEWRSQANFVLCLLIFLLNLTIGFHYSIWMQLKVMPSKFAGRSSQACDHIKCAHPMSWAQVHNLASLSFIKKRQNIRLTSSSKKS
jgi:hypothetical protein